MPTTSYVDANYRFVAAYQEINARIAQRQQALALYVTLIVSLLAALVALKPGEGSGKLPLEWLVLGFPVASTCLVFLNLKTEQTITNLRNFVSTLEQRHNAHHVLPSYNTDPIWAAGANKARRFHDFAAGVLVTGGNTIGLGAVIKIYPERIAENPVVIWFTVIVSIASLVALLMIPKWGYMPSEQKV
jgi:hypothetical protein